MPEQPPSRGQHQVKADEPSWPKTCHGLCCGASFTSSSIRFNDKSSSGHLSRPCQGVSAIFSPGLRSRVQQWQRFHPLTFTPGKFKVCRCQCGKSKRPRECVATFLVLSRHGILCLELTMPSDTTELSIVILRHSIRDFQHHRPHINFHDAFHLSFQLS